MSNELENPISNDASISGYGGGKQVGRKTTCRDRKRKSTRPRFPSVEVKKKRKNTGGSSYSHAELKSRNLLTNILHRRLNNNDQTNISFVVD